MVKVLITKEDGTPLETVYVTEEVRAAPGNSSPSAAVRTARKIADLIERNFEHVEDV